jgi:flagellar motility protein MotE (MotC chaperone)
MYNYSLFDSFFAPTRVIVVSEEQLKKKEIELKENQIKVIDNRIDELTKYRLEVQGELNNLLPAAKVEDAA